MFFLRFLLCVFIPLSAVFLSGYGNVMADISDSLAATTFVGGVLVIAFIIFAILEIYLSLKKKINELEARLSALDGKNDSSEEDIYKGEEK